MKTIFFRPRVVSLLTQSVERNARETIVTTRMNERREELECTPLTETGVLAVYCPWQCHEPENVVNGRRRLRRQKSLARGRGFKRNLYGEVSRSFFAKCLNVYRDMTPKIAMISLLYCFLGLKSILRKVRYFLCGDHQTNQWGVMFSSCFYKHKSIFWVHDFNQNICRENRKPKLGFLFKFWVTWVLRNITRLILA